MKSIVLKSLSFLSVASNLEKKHKLITYVSLLLLTLSTYLLRDKNQTLKIGLAKLNQKNISLVENMFIFNSNYEKFPLAVWQKVKRGDKFIIQYVNPAYVKQLGHLFKNDPSAHIGKSNFDIYPKKYAQEYYEKELAVAITGEELNSIDEIFDIEGKKAFVKVVKWREIQDKKDTLIYGMIKGVIKNKK